MSRILVIGPGGIGRAIAHLASNEGDIVDIAGREKPGFLHEQFFPYHLHDEKGIIEVAEHIANQQVDTVIHTIGILHDEDHSPEKSITQLNEDWFIKNMRINCLAPMLMLKSLTDTLPKESRLRFVALSARVGSIEDNQLGGWLSYRTSKAALNMGIRTVAIEWRRLFKYACIVGYQPGTVDTPLSKPFQTNVPQLFTPEQAALYLYQFSQSITPEMSGYLYDWQKTRIPF